MLYGYNMSKAWSSHSKKEVRRALAEAAEAGFEVKATNTRGHSWGYVDCPDAECTMRLYVWSTPKNPNNHAMQIRRFVERHRHDQEEGGVDAARREKGP